MKRIIPICLVLALSIVSWFPNSAMAQGLNSTQVYLQNLSSDSLYDRYTITFTLPEETLSNNYSLAELNLFEKTVVQTHNENAVNQAKDYLYSLNLADSGFELIEESCLMELEEMKDDTNYMLESYTIKVPKINESIQNKPAATDEQVPPAWLTYYGTYANTDFYFYFFSEAEKTTQFKKVSNGMEDWFKNLAELVLCFADVEVGVSSALIKSVMQATIGYTPTSNAYAEYYFDVLTDTRGIYAFHNAVVGYDVVTTQQRAALYPYVVYYPVQRPQYQGSYNVEIGFSGMVYTPKFDDTEYQLKRAYQHLFLSASVDPDDDIMVYLPNHFWRYE